MGGDVTWAIVAAVLWVASGVIGGPLISFPGDGLNRRHFFGALTGPSILILALFGRSYLP